MSSTATTKVGWRAIFNNKITLLCRNHFVALCVLNSFAQFAMNMCFYFVCNSWRTIDYSRVRAWGMEGYWVFEVCQDAGAVISRFMGIRWVNEIKPAQRLWWMLILYGMCWIGLLLFALLPWDASFIAMLLNGFAFGVAWPVNYAYVDGRRFSGLVGSVMSISRAAGQPFVDLCVRDLVKAPWLPQTLVPITISGIVFVPYCCFLFLVESMPETEKADIAMRGERPPMTSDQRSKFYRDFGFAIVMMCIMYMLNQIYDDYKAFFEARVLAAMGLDHRPSSMTWFPMVSAAIVVIPCGLIQLLQSSQAQFLSYVGLIAMTNVLLIVLAALGQANIFRGEIFLCGTQLLNYWASQPFEAIIYDVFIACMKAQANSSLLINIFRGVSTLETLAFQLLCRFAPNIQPNETQASFCRLTGVFAFAGLAVNALQVSYQMWRM